MHTVPSLWSYLLWKNRIVLDLLATEYAGMFENIVILCPTIEWYKTYKNKSWIADVLQPKYKNITNYNKRRKIDASRTVTFILWKVCLQADTVYRRWLFGHKIINKEKSILSKLAYSGRHADQSVWVILQRYISVLIDFHEQTKWVCMFNTQDMDSFENCLSVNDVIRAL